MKGEGGKVYGLFIMLATLPRERVFRCRWMLR